MKIIHVIPTLTNGGAEKMVLNHITNLVKFGHTNVLVSFYTNQTSFIFQELERLCVKVVFLNKKRGLDLSIFFKLSSIFKNELPSVVHTHLRSLIYCLPSYFLNQTFYKIHTIHSSPKNEGGLFHFLFYKFYFRNGKVIPIAISKINQLLIKSYYKLEYLPPIVFNGIPIRLVSSELKFQPSSKINFVHVGRFSEEKNHPFLLQIFSLILSKYSHALLHLYGEGPLLDKTKALASSMKISNSIIFHGLVDDASAIINKYNIFLFTSKWEGFPLAVIEALANGLPVISTNAGGITEIVKSNYNGFICTTKECFIEKIDKLIKNPKLYSKFSKRSINSSLRFSSINMTADYLKIYENNFKVL